MKKRPRNAEADEPFYRENPRAQVMRRLRTWIADGTLPAGEELPAERDLAARLEVTRPTLNRAIADLVAEGVISPRAGRSRVVTHAATASPKGRTILVLTTPVPDVPSEPPRGSPEFMILGVCAAARAAGLHALVVDSRQIARQDLEALFAQGLGGVVVAVHNLGAASTPRTVRWIADQCGDRSLPLTIFGDDFPTIAATRVASDHRLGGYLLAQRLIGMGCRRLVQVGVTGIDAPWWRARCAGYQEAAREAGAELIDVTIPACGPSDPLVPADLTRAARSTTKALSPLFPATARHPSAVLALNDSYAVVIAHAFHQLDDDLAKSVLIAGYDDAVEESWPAQLCPERPAVTVDRCMWACGYALMQPMRSGKGQASQAPHAPPAPIVTLVPPSVIARDVPGAHHSILGSSAP